MPDMAGFFIEPSQFIMQTSTFHFICIVHNRYLLYVDVFFFYQEKFKYLKKIVLIL